MQFKSVSECLENYYCGSIKYQNVVCEPTKDQIKGDALNYLLKFIDDCFLEETIMVNKIKYNLWLQKYKIKKGG